MANAELLGDPTQLMAFLQNTLSDLEEAAGGLPDVEARMKLDQLQAALKPKAVLPKNEVDVAAELEKLEQQLMHVEQLLADTGTSTKEILSQAVGQQLVGDTLAAEDSEPSAEADAPTTNTQ